MTENNWTNVVEAGRKALGKKKKPIRDFVLWGIVGVTLATGCWVHGLAGNTLPLPWDDEVLFFWPAVHWAQENTLAAGELNPDRALQWMPPGMMVTLGTLFKWLPIRLDIARWVSWGMLALGYVCCACWIWRLKRALFGVVLLSLFFLNGAFTAAGNVARMDSWVWGMAAVAFAILHSSKGGNSRRLAWTLLGCSPLVHPNGLYFLFAAGLAEAGERLSGKLGRSKSSKSPFGSKWGVLLWGMLVAGVWVAYVIYAGCHGKDWVSDMAFQFNRKGARAPWTWILSWPTLGCLGWYLFFGVHALWRSPRNLWLVGWGGANLMTYVIGREMWYEIFWQTGWLWLVVLGFQLDLPVRGRWEKFATVSAMCLLFAWAGAFFFKHGFIEGPRGYSRELSWGWGMRLEQEGAYISSEDVACLKSKLDDAAEVAGKPIRVEFFPGGDQLLLLECFNEQIHPFAPTFTEQKGDCTVVHVSRYRPSWLDVRDKIPNGAPPFHERGGSEQWYFLWNQPGGDVP